MTDTTKAARVKRWARRVATAAGFVALVVVLMLWLWNTLGAKVDKVPSAGEPARPAAGVARGQVTLMDVPLVESAVGSIRPIHEAAVAAKVQERVVAIRFTAGQSVNEGDVLVVLDTATLKAREEQARTAVVTAEGEKKQAETELAALKKAQAGNAATAIQVSRAETTLRSAEQALERAGQALKETETARQDATVRAPFSGIVIDKKVNVGDMARPGEPLLTMYNQMQLVASVRETLAQKLKKDMEIGVEIDALSLKCRATISEIVPEAQTASRTFSVKVTGPCPPGAYPGMFGRLFVPIGHKQVIVAPAAAVQQVGQLTLVDVIEGDRLERRAVQLGRTHGSLIEVLSGLKPGQWVALPPGTTAPASRAAGDAGGL